MPTLDEHPRDPVEEHFAAAVRALDGAQAGSDLGSLGPDRCLELFDAQLGSRHLDVAARLLRASGAGYYTIGSSGHESNAAVAAALRLDDPALLHYRSGAFYLARAAQAGHDGITDVLLGLVGAAAEPIAGGRHKVFGHRGLNVIPQTSTIASHLPRAVGLAFALARGPKLAGALGLPWPGDAIVVCSLGDASVNHSTAAGALNTAAYCAYQGLPLPLLLVCEDNGLGISVRTPPGWVAAARSGSAAVRYLRPAAEDLAAVYDAAAEAAAWVRERRAPAFLHLPVVRLGGHAGSDVESAYRGAGEIAADARRDPLLGTARLLAGAGVLSPAEILDRYEAGRARVLARAAELAGSPGLASAAEVMAPLAPRRPARVAASIAARARAGASARAGAGAAGPPAGLTLAQAINKALSDELAARPGMLVFGEDVARKGGVYGVTRGLLRGFGAGRVFDTLLDEQAILGLALGAGLAGLLPVPEIQYLAYLHNAADQLRGEAATLSFFSRAQYRNPMVVRVAGLAYQKGFGGHFHNDNSVAALRDIPGLVIACPARPEDAAAMLATCLAAADVDGTVSVFLEPIALYHERDLHAAGDDGWLSRPGPAPGAVLPGTGLPGTGPSGTGLPGTALPGTGPLTAGAHVPVGQGRVHGDGADLTIVTFGNGLRMSLRAARRLGADGIGCRVLDLRWLAPLPAGDLLREASATGRVLVADETRRTGGVAEGVLSVLADAGYAGRARRVTSEDSFVPLGDAAGTVLLSEAAIEAAAREMVR